LEPAPTQVAPSPDVEVALNEPEGELEVSAPVPHVEGRRSRWGVLRHKHYRNVWFGQFGSSLGGWMESVGVGWIINTTSKDPAVMLGYLALAQLGPMMLFGIPGGILADRMNRKLLLLITQFAMMMIAAGLAVASYVSHAKPNVAVMIVLVLLNGAAIPFNAPAWQVLTPRLVPREELTNAIFLNGLQFNLARAVGPALAGVLYYWFGPTILFVINTMSFIGVMVAVASTPNTPTPPPTGVSVLHQFKEAQRFVLRERGPRAVLIAIVVIGLLAAPLMRLMPMFVTHVFTQTKLPAEKLASATADSAEHSGAYGFLLAMMGLGAVTGVGLVRFIPKWYPKHHMIPVSILGGGIFITLFASTTNYYLACVTLFFGGIFWLWSFNSAFAAMQILVPDAMRGRVMAIVNVAVFGSMAIGPLLTGKLGSGLNAGSAHIDAGLGIQIGVAATGAALTLAALVMLIWRTPEVDGLKPGDPGYDRRPGLIRGITGSVHRPEREAHCPKCGYALRGLEFVAGSVTCPECGTVIEAEMVKRLKNKPRAFP
jgi:MFS family permease